MSGLPKTTSINIWNDCCNVSTILWAFIWAATFHYLPLLWKHRQLIAKEFREFYMFYYILFSWAYSDSFFAMALVFTKIHKKSLANVCGRQSMKTFGTFPLLVIASEFKMDKTNSDLHYEPLAYPNKFDFLFILKQIITRSNDGTL